MYFMVFFILIFVVEPHPALWAPFSLLRRREGVEVGFKI
jgi:hypothetical protein